MADTKISDFASGGVIQSDDVVPATRAGTTYKVNPVGADGWTPSGETWTYASADSPTFTFTVPADVTTKYSPGMRVKLTQTTVKYFIITAVSTYSGGVTTITVYGGTDYTLANATITLPYYSAVKAPAGFPLNPAKWTVSVTDTSLEQQNAPGVNTWYNIGSPSINIPIGSWNVEYNVCAVGVHSSSGNCNVWTTLSTANNSESDTDFSAITALQPIAFIFNQHSKRKTLNLSSKTTYYLNTKTSASSMGSVRIDNTITPMLLKAVCAYL